MLSTTEKAPRISNLRVSGVENHGNIHAVQGRCSFEQWAKWWTSTELSLQIDFWLITHIQSIELERPLLSTVVVYNERSLRSCAGSGLQVYKQAMLRPCIPFGKHSEWCDVWPDAFTILFSEVVSKLFGCVALIVIVCCLGRPRGIWGQAHML